MDDRLAKLKVWIEGHGHKDVVPVRVTLNLTKTKTATFEGVRFIFKNQIRDLLGNIIRVEYGRLPSFYLLGMVPKHLLKGFRCNVLDGTDVFLSAYLVKWPVEEQFNQFYPFGPTFSLSQWDEEQTKSKIDTHEKRQYDRFPMTVEELTDS